MQLSALAYADYILIQNTPVHVDPILPGSPGQGDVQNEIVGRQTVGAAGLVLTSVPDGKMAIYACQWHYYRTPPISMADSVQEVPDLKETYDVILAVGVSMDHIRALRNDRSDT